MEFDGVKGTGMADLRLQPSCMSTFLKHLKEREGVIEHFYCDSQGLVTIAIGYLVDRRGGSRQRGLARARSLAERADVVFTRKEDEAPATVEDVQADWRRTKDFGARIRPARAYREVTKLRIDEPSIDAITTTLVQGYADQLYGRRPFILGYDTRVAMALVDARYNPAGVVLYGSKMQPFWEALDPNHRSWNLDRALQLFDQTWAGARVMERQPAYFERHQQRLAWLREGLMAPSEERAVAAIS